MNDVEKLQMLYEAHFYHNLSREEQDDYYDLIRSNISEDVNKFEEISQSIYDLIEKLEFINLTKLDGLFTSFTDDPEGESKKMRIFISEQIHKLKDVAHNLSENNVKSDLVEILTGTSL